MITLEICDGITLTCSEETVTEYAHLQNKFEDEFEDDSRLIAYLRSDEGKRDENYSDMYKDVYGFRPRREDGTVCWGAWEV